MFKVNNRSNRKRSKICSKLTKKTIERGQWCRSGVFIVNFEHISYIFLVFQLLALILKVLSKYGRQNMTDKKWRAEFKFDSFFMNQELLGKRLKNYYFYANFMSTILCCCGRPYRLTTNQMCDHSKAPFKNNCHIFWRPWNMSDIFPNWHLFV